MPTPCGWIARCPPTKASFTKASFTKASFAKASFAKASFQSWESLRDTRRVSVGKYHLPQERIEEDDRRRPWVGVAGGLGGVG